jgi:hypothetical protein
MEINKKYLVNADAQISLVPTLKSQILLAHTSSTISEHFTKIFTRHCGEYPSIFTYTIDKEGVIYQHYDPDYYSRLFGIAEIDKQIISIGLENEGWLWKKDLNSKIFDWKGCIYNGEVLNKLWRGHNLWAVYTDKQMESMLFLIKQLLQDYNIQPKFSGNNLPLDNAREFEGVLNRSNYFKFYTDLSPACNFENINDYISQL